MSSSNVGIILAATVACEVTWQSAPFEEKVYPVGVQCAGRVKDEAVMLPQKPEFPASLDSAFRLVFRAVIEVAEPADVVVGRVQQEDIDLKVA